MYAVLPPPKRLGDYLGSTDHGTRHLRLSEGWGKDVQVLSGREQIFLRLRRCFRVEV